MDERHRWPHGCGAGQVGRGCGAGSRWALYRLAGVDFPFLGVLVGADEPMGWGTRPRHVEPYVPATGRLEYFEDLGHFIHIEAPEMTADLVLDFLGDPR